ncbi:hypothetical protein J7F01_04785 [Streptomyces sp. ISL-22]|uniref:Imm50 family immunity protein n=1 Tax=unclassified Streptomyces TaxID=2593676 RepID=UPI001BEBCB3A|nr:MULTISPECIES: Imm50 family immunity protein [unclassified Streptomyces]MBT2418181.1 hypothetical protein [Streptomyces sp. ISL-24]MBT2431529.1 hypothetical protein [Streptomyces sp. ISL-22]
MPNDWPLALTSERGRLVTLGLETEVMPSPLPDEWGAKGFNTCEFFIVLGDASNVRIYGWGASVANAVTVSGSPDGSISV